MAAKRRLDMLVLERELAPDIAKAQAYIMAGEILVNGTVVDKPGMSVLTAAEIVHKAKSRYVSRGGDKLAAALDAFSLQISGFICADVGASTGGFTDCLLQQGAAHVYAIDVAYGELAYSLRSDPRVTPIERTNVRFLESLPKPTDLVVIDASFISLRLLLPTVKKWLKPSAHIVALIKPQFEAEAHDVEKGGVVRSQAVHQQVLTETLKFAHGLGFALCGLVRSPLKGPAGNIEFLTWLGWNIDFADVAIDTLIASVV